MLKANLIAILITIMFQLNSNAGTLSRTSDPELNQDKYSLEVTSTEQESTYLINFTIPDECFVSLKVIDINGNVIDEIVSDEMSAGNYKVFYVSPVNLLNGKEKYEIKIYQNRNNLQNVVYSKEITMNTEK